MKIADMPEIIRDLVSMPSNPVWKVATPEQLKAFAGMPRQTFDNPDMSFACRKGCMAGMPKTPHRTRYSSGPATMSALMRGRVTKISEDGLKLKVADDHDNGGWVSIDHVLVFIDSN